MSLSSSPDETITLLLLQPTGFCNIDCKYCYLPDRSSRKKMSLEVISDVFKNVFSSERIGPSLDVSWHAGEPLTLPVSYYRTAFRTIETLRPPNLLLNHIFQTNGTLLTQDWCDLIKEWHVILGLSIDGPQDLHDSKRVDRRGRGTFDQVMRGAELLRQNSIKYHVICVLTADSLEDPNRLFRFFQNLGVNEICFNFEEIEGINASSSLDVDGIEQRARSFIRDYYRANQREGFPQWVREIDGSLNSLLLADLSVPSNALTTAFKSINVDPDGNFSTFCPELLTIKNNKYGSFVIGNLRYQTITECSNSSQFFRLNAEVQLGVDRCRKSCRYFGICGGGAPSNKLFETGSLASTETLHCRLTVQAVADVAMEMVTAAIERAHAEN